MKVVRRNLWWLVPALAWSLFGAVMAQAQGTGFNARSVVSFSSSGNNTIVAAQTGKRISVWGLDISCASTILGKFRSGASTDLMGAITMNAYSKPLTNMAPYFQTAAGDALVFNSSGAVACGGVLWYSAQ